MAISLNTADVMSVSRYPIKTPNPSDTVDSILKQLSEIENEIDSPQINAEMDELETGGVFFGRNTQKVMNIKLRDTKTSDLKKFGGIIYPVEFGNLVYLTKYEYLKSWFGFTSAGERDANIRKRLTTIDKYNEYLFTQTITDWVFINLIKKNDPDVMENLPLYRQFLSW